MSLRITICRRDYSQWYFTNIETNERIEGTIDISTYKCFSGDIVNVKTPGIVEGDGISLVSSVVRSSPYIAGILILDNNRTFGRTANKKRLLYKCIPNNPQYPAFLIPYETTLGFSKCISNKYVLFRFDSWKDARPNGILTEVIGDVSAPGMFHEYQLYCRNLRDTIAPIVRVMRSVSLPDVLPSVVDTPDTFIFSIDPPGSTDIDDAFSISTTPDGTRMVSVYIANVFAWLETLRLWEAMSNRVSTIYFPSSEKYPMLPSALSDTCSLLENAPRFAFVMNVEVRPNGVIVDETATFQTVPIRVSKNYHYESPDLLQNPHYQSLATITRINDASVRDSHDIVAFWMIQMNRICGAFLFSNQIGIFRSFTHTSSTITPDIESISDESTRKFLRNWQNTNCTYCPFVSGDIQYTHSEMNIQNYTHITSPIRRLVDIVNQTLFISKITGVSREALDFCEKWITNIDALNSSMKSIRKLQSDCEMLHLCNTNPALLSGEHSGILMDKRANDDFTFTYTVYLGGNIRRISRVRTIHQYDNYTMHMFRLFFFVDEDNVQTKIRLQLIVKNPDNKDSENPDNKDSKNPDNKDYTIQPN